jgi:predicted ATPase
MPINRNRIFISYSHADELWLSLVKKHLRPLERNHKLQIFADDSLKAGEIWRSRIDSELAQARVAIMLVSADFLVSDWINSQELPMLLAAAERQSTTIIPIIVRPCAFSTSPLAKFQALNNPEIPLSSMSSTQRDQVMVKLLEELTRIFPQPATSTMLMDSIHIKNFRSLRELELEKLTRVNLLMGKNNSGKTSVLEAIYALTNIEEPWWAEQLESTRGIEKEDQDFRSLFYNFNVTNAVQVNANYKGVGRGPSKYRFQLEEDESGAKRGIKSRRNGQKSLLVTIWLGARNSGHTFKMTRDQDTDEMVYTEYSENADEFLEEGLPDKMAVRHTSTFVSTTLDLEQLGEQLAEVTVNKEEEPLLEVMKQIDPRVKSFTLDNNGRIYLDLGENFSMRSAINLMGEGIQRLLSIVAALASVAGGIILIDEIDNGLHYSALRILWQGILAAADEYDVQVVATTHNAEALRHLTAVLENDQWARYRNNVAAYTLVRADNDTVRSYRYGYEQLSNALDHDIEVRS